MNHEIEHVLNVHNEIGGAPLWVPEEQTVYWTDTEANMVWSYKPKTGAKESWTPSPPVTAIMRRKNGGFLMVAKTGPAFWDRDTNTCELAANPLADSKTLWFNDGAVDRQGRLVTGTMNHRALTARDGSLYRLDPNLDIIRLDTGLSAVGGICFSPDGGTMYVSEQFRGHILSYDYDTAKGSLSRRRVFARLPESGGLPDANVDLQITMPVPVVTCMAFAGDRLNELHVTTGWYGLKLAERKEKPGCGDLFRIRTGFTGLVEPHFRG